MLVSFTSISKGLNCNEIYDGAKSFLALQDKSQKHEFSKEELYAAMRFEAYYNAFWNLTVASHKIILKDMRNATPSFKPQDWMIKPERAAASIIGFVDARKHKASWDAIKTEDGTSLIFSWYLYNAKEETLLAKERASDLLDMLYDGLPYEKLVIEK